MNEEKKPRILDGICEFCGVPADKCEHHGTPEVEETASEEDVDPSVTTPSTEEEVREVLGDEKVDAMTPDPEEDVDQE